jgi:FAD:protein FMN transferase
MKKHFLILVTISLFLAPMPQVEGRRQAQESYSWEKFKYFKKVDPYLKISIGVIAPYSQKRTVDRSVAQTFKELSHVYDKVSEYKKNSDTSMVNRNAGIQPTQVGPDLVRILIVAHKINALTAGRFDIVDRALNKKASLDNLLLDMKDNTVKMKNKNTQIRVFELLKGYLAERAALSLRQNGWQNFIVNVGGEIRAAGRDLGKNSWIVHVQDPQQKRGKSVCSVNLINSAISTAGIYERSAAFFDKRKRRSRSDLASVSVIHRDALMASTLAVAAFQEGSSRAARLVRSIPGAEAVIIGREGHVQTVGGASAACIQ